MFYFNLYRITLSEFHINKGVNKKTRFNQRECMGKHTKENKKNMTKQIILYADDLTVGNSSRRREKCQRHI